MRIGDTPAVTVGVEEEFHTVSLSSRRLTAQGSRVLEQLPAGQFSAELHQTMVEANSRPHARLADLAADLAALRRAAIAAATRCELGVVAAGTVPIADPPDTGTVTASPRYEHMRGEYGTLVSEQLICAMQVHVSVADRDLAVAIAHRVSPCLPALLALSTSSPYWLGTDTGYASYRTMLWRRWPTTGVGGGFASAADYDQTVADLVRSGVITDPGMIYFDVRPSAHLPTLELRICDGCPYLQDVVLLAGLFRALVMREADAAIAGRASLPVRPELLEAATWRAARSGLEGDLVDPAAATAVPAGRPDPANARGPAARAGGQRRLGAGDRARRGGTGPGQLGGTPACGIRQRRLPGGRRRPAQGDRRRYGPERRRLTWCSCTVRRQRP